jgi:hypothetical protein
VWQARHRRAWWLLTQAIARGDADLLKAARAALEAAERSHPSPPWYVYKNLGIVYDRLAAAGAPQLHGEQLRVWGRYLELAPTSDPQRAAIAAAVTRLKARP